MKGAEADTRPTSLVIVPNVKELVKNVCTKLFKQKNIQSFVSRDRPARSSAAADRVRFDTQNKQMNNWGWTRLLPYEKKQLAVDALHRLGPGAVVADLHFTTSMTIWRHRTLHRGSCQEEVAAVPRHSDGMARRAKNLRQRGRRAEGDDEDEDEEPSQTEALPKGTRSRRARSQSAQMDVDNGVEESSRHSVDELVGAARGLSALSWASAPPPGAIDETLGAVLAASVPTPTHQPQAVLGARPSVGSPPPCPRQPIRREVNSWRSDGAPMEQLEHPSNTHSRLFDNVADPSCRAPACPSHTSHSFVTYRPSPASFDPFSYPCYDLPISHVAGCPSSRAASTAPSSAGASSAYSPATALSSLPPSPPSFQTPPLPLESDGIHVSTASTSVFVEEHRWLAVVEPTLYAPAPRDRESFGSTNTGSGSGEDSQDTQLSSQELRRQMMATQRGGGGRALVPRESWPEFNRAPSELFPGEWMRWCGCATKRESRLLTSRPLGVRRSQMPPGSR